MTRGNAALALHHMPAHFLGFRNKPGRPTPASTPTKHARACDEIDEEDFIRWDHGRRTYAIYRAEDGFYCTDGMCTHEATHLEDGLLIGHVIECPLHQGRFDIRSGKVVSPPPCEELNTYPVKTENGQVYVKVWRPGGESDRRIAWSPV